MNYLTIISRSDFSDLYKFGHIFVHNAVPFDGELNEHIDDKQLFDAVTTYMNTFEYSTEYLMLHFCKTPFTGGTVELFMQDVEGVYALDSEAKASLSVSLDPRINLQVSDWAEFFKDLNKKQSIRLANGGRFNCFEIFNISEEDRRATSKFLSQNIVVDLFDDLFASRRPNGPKPIWVYLIRYERHDPYWNDTRGFFSDAIHVYENYKKQEEIGYEIADEVPLGDVLAQCGNVFNDIYKTLSESKHNIYKIDGCDYLAVAALYLYLKSYFKDGGITAGKLKQANQIYNGHIYELYGFNYALAVALLGLTLGQELTYSCYYEIKNLGIFNYNVTSKEKKTEASPIIDPQTGTELSNESAQDLINRQNVKIVDLQKRIEELEEISKQAQEVPIVESAIDETKPSVDIIEADQPDNTSSNLQEDNIIMDVEKEAKPNGENSSGIILQSKIGTMSDVEDNVDSSLESNQDISLAGSTNQSSEDDYFEPVVMKKKKKRGKGFTKDAPKYAHTKEEYNDFIRQGYVPEDYFDKQQTFF